MAKTLVPVTSLAVLAAASCGGGGYDAKSKSTEELIATVQDASVGNPTDKERRDDPGARCNAAEELGRRKATAAVDVLVAALGDGLVDGCAARALGAIGDARAVLPLVEAFGQGVEVDIWPYLDTNCGVFYGPSLCIDWETVREALRQIGNAGTEQLIALTHSTDWSALEESCSDQMSEETSRSEASESCKQLAKFDVVLTVLSELGDRRAEPVLIEKLADNPGHGLVTLSRTRSKPHDSSEIPAWALVEMYSDDVEHLFPLLQSEETVDIAYGLIRLGKAGTEQPLIDGLMQFGNVTLAIFYLNCGNDQLEAAANDWAKANGYTVTTQWRITAGGTQVWGTG